MEGKLEVITIPVRDLERARRFYADRVGFQTDIDEDNFVQLTPKGSGCSVHLKAATPESPPGSAEALLVVEDVHAARDELIEGGVEVTEVQEFDRATGTFRPLAHEPDWNAFVFFRDPDGNRWIVQHRGG